MTTNPPEASADLSTLLRMKILEYKAARPYLSSQQIAKKFWRAGTEMQFLTMVRGLPPRSS
jgi:hypothetical protein